MLYPLSLKALSAIGTLISSSTLRCVVLKGCGSVVVVVVCCSSAVEYVLQLRYLKVMKHGDRETKYRRCFCCWWYCGGGLAVVSHVVDGGVVGGGGGGGGSAAALVVGGVSIADGGGGGVHVGCGVLQVYCHSAICYDKPLNMKVNTD